MSSNQNWDGYLPISLDLNYSRYERELDPEPRLINGKNAFITLGGKLCKRPGTLSIAQTAFAKRIDRLWIYETLETPPKVYIMASAFNTTLSTWGLYYNRLDGASPGWTAVPSLRQINSSTRAHEAIAARGLFFAKGFPSVASGEKLGTITFDGKGSGTPISSFWGLLGPTIAARIVGQTTTTTADLTSGGLSVAVASTTGFPAAPFNAWLDFEEVTVTVVGGLNLTITRGTGGTTPDAHVAGTLLVWKNWPASTHNVTTQIGWTYSYAYKTSTGHISNRAPVETNPDLMPSSTGPFLNQTPKITIQGTADTTNIPTIVVFRSTDGGGIFYKLEEITNTGAGAITYTDKSLASGAGGGTLNDPLPDTSLSIADFAPSLTSNSPPPTVNSPLVVGADTPVASTPLAYFQGRVWYALGNILYFSSQEELPTGIPEEAWPSGIKGNFFRFQYPIVNLEATTEALYIMTLQATYIIFGNNLETFNVNPVLTHIGAPYGHPRAITKFGEKVVFLAHDFRIIVVQGKNYDILSDPLYTDMVDLLNNNTGTEIEITYWGDLDKEWIIVTGIVAGNPDKCRQWVYDIKKSDKTKKDFWFVPWDLPAVATVSGRIKESISQRRLGFFLWNNTAFSQIVYLDPTGVTATDDLPTPTTTGTTSQSMDFNITTNLFMVPTGNHVNALRESGIIPEVYNFRVERTKFDNDEDPRTYFYTDDLWSNPFETLPTSEDPARIDPTTGYKTSVYPVHRLAYRFAIKLTKAQSKDRFELQNLIIVWEPDSGDNM